VLSEQCPNDLGVRGEHAGRGTVEVQHTEIGCRNDGSNRRRRLSVNTRGSRSAQDSGRVGPGCPLRTH
jgi:hypothetical protein